MKEKNYKKCVICGKEYPCTPSRNVVTCSRECRLKYLSQNHKGLKMSAATREKMAESRKKVPNSAEIQRMATEAAKKSPKSGRFITNKAAIDWHLVSPEGEHFHIHSLAFWLRENHEMFGVEPDTREFKNVISGLSRVKRAMLGKIGDGQRVSSPGPGTHSPIHIKSISIKKIRTKPVSMIDTGFANNFI